MFVKICGLRDRDSLTAALEAGADAVGFVVSPGSPRDADPDLIADLVAAVDGAAETVLVVSHATPAEAVALARRTGVGILQLHGAYTEEDVAAVRAADVRVWRAASVAGGTPLDVGAWGEEVLLLDSPIAGSGHRWDSSTVETEGRWMLAGGLDPSNVAEAIRESRPWGVDVSSGVESSRGVKDPALIRAFVEAVRAQSSPSNSPPSSSQL